MHKRITRCIEEIKNSNLDALLVSNPANITYLSGFRSGEGYLLVTRDRILTYFTNFIHRDEAKKINIWKVNAGNFNIFKRISDQIKDLGLHKIGFEAKDLPFLEYEKIREYLSWHGADLLKTIDLIEKLRTIKTTEEISLIKKSIAISKEAFKFINEIYADTMNEKCLSIEIEKFLKLKGDNEIAFAPIVAFGKNSAFPHHAPRETKLGNNYFLIDLGSRYCGYCADLTRVFFWGKMPTLFKKIYGIVKKAHSLCIDKIKEGVKAKDVDRAAREFIEKKGFGKYFGHGTGHGVGLAVHELPFLHSKNDEILEEGMVITIEPAIYLERKFGIRIEDMILVKKTGREILSGDVNW